MRGMTGLLMAMLATMPGLAAAQQPVSAETETAAYREMAAVIPLGSRVRVQTKDGRSISATLMRVTSDGIVVKREGRLPEPAIEIGFADLTRLQRDDRRGVSIAKAIGIGIASGAGALLALIAFAYAISD